MKQKIFWNFRNSGFGSCFNLTVVAYVYAQHHGHDFVLFSQDSDICNTVWTDYFLPFAEQQNICDENFDIDNFLPIQTIWNYKFTGQNNIILNNKQFKGNCFEACQVIAKEIWSFNEETQICIDNKIKKLNMPKKYICLHIRQGDKLREIKEREFPDVSQYIKLAHKISSIIDFFVMTDDVRVVEKLKNKYKNYNFYTLADMQTGFDIRTYNNKDKQFRYNSTIALLTDVEIAKKADIFIGTYSSNIFRLVSLFKKTNQMHAIDCEYHKLLNKFIGSIPNSKFKKFKNLIRFL